MLDRARTVLRELVPVIVIYVVVLLVGVAFAAVMGGLPA